MSEDKNILIVSYTFPPTPGIGGRRWAKFSKYLTREGYTVHIITADSDNKGPGDWLSDVKEYGSRIFRLKTSYPVYLTITPKSLQEKVMYRLALLYMKIRVKGNFYDRSNLWKGRLLPQMEKLIVEKKISTVVITCAPFRMAYYSLELRQKFPALRWIVDFRDPWAGSVFYGLESLSIKRRNYEKAIEKEVAARADIILTVAEEMTSYYAELSGNSSKCFTISNGFDAEDFTAAVHATEPGKKEIKFIFTGTLYDKATHHVIGLCESLSKIREKLPEIYESITFDFFGSVPASIEQLMAEHSNIKLNGKVPNAEIYSRITKSDICMSFLTDEVTYCFNTKFFEYLSQRKTIALFSKRGTAAAYIVENNLGYAIEPGEIEEKVIQIYNDFMTNRLVKSKDFNIDEHNVRNITKKLTAVIV